MKKIKLGVVCLTRNTFDFEAANGLYENIKKDLRQLEDVEVVAVERAVMEQDEAIEAAKMFCEKGVNGIAIISGTFHLGHLALEIKKRCDVPLLLWGLPELPYNGGKIRLNSVCGVNLNASNLVKSGKTDFTYTVGNKIDMDFIQALRMITALKEARIGIIGYRAHGFFNVGVDELSLYGKYGCIVDHFELADLFGTAEKEEYVDRYKSLMKESFSTVLEREKAEKVARLAAKFRTFSEKNGLSVLAVRCWPEFAASYGIAPCAAMSLAQADGVLLSCEGDIDCAITMLCHKAIGAETPFMADLSQVSVEEDSALMWHCGVAPCNLASKSCDCTLDTYHAGGKGVTAGFVLKTGKINMARLDSVGGKYRLFLERGEALEMDKVLSGTYAKVRFETPMAKLLDRVIYSGIAHHVSMVYGDYTKAFTIFAKLTATEEV